MPPRFLINPCAHSPAPPLAWIYGLTRLRMHQQRQRQEEEAYVSPGGACERNQCRFGQLQGWGAVRIGKPNGRVPSKARAAHAVGFGVGMLSSPPRVQSSPVLRLTRLAVAAPSERRRDMNAAQVRRLNHGHSQSPGLPAGS